MKPVYYLNINKKDSFHNFYTASFREHEDENWECVPLYAIDLTEYKVVPLEPTEEMKSCMPEMFNGEELEQVYENMIEAAPDIEDIE